MKIAIGSDHRGYDLKSGLIKQLQSNNYEVIDCGTNSLDSVDYPDYAKKVCELIQNKESDFGITICGSGIGMSIACNKYKGIRCAKVSNEEEAYYTRQDNNANVIALNGNIPLEEAYKIVLKFLNTDFSNESRHLRRLDKINKIENE